MEAQERGWGLAEGVEVSVRRVKGSLRGVGAGEESGDSAV